MIEKKKCLKIVLVNAFVFSSRFLLKFINSIQKRDRFKKIYKFQKCKYYKLKKKKKYTHIRIIIFWRFYLEMWSVKLKLKNYPVILIQEIFCFLVTKTLTYKA